MPLSQTLIHNYNPNLSVPGEGVPPGDPTLYENANPVADVRQLIPGQCLLFTDSDPTTNIPPRTYDVVARLDNHPDLIFWAAEFEVGSATDSQPCNCPAAARAKLTICVMPRKRPPIQTSRPQGRISAIRSILPCGAGGSPFSATAPCLLPINRHHHPDGSRNAVASHWPEPREAADFCSCPRLATLAVHLC